MTCARPRNLIHDGRSDLALSKGVALLSLGFPAKAVRRRRGGQTSIEFVVVCAALAVAIGLAASGPDSVLVQLRDAFRVSYQKISFSLSLPY